MVTDEDFLFGKPVEEVDEPLDTAPSVDINLEVKKLEEKDKIEKKRDTFLLLS